MTGAASGPPSRGAPSGPARAGAGGPAAGGAPRAAPAPRTGATGGNANAGAAGGGANANAFQSQVNLTKGPFSLTSSIVDYLLQNGMKQDHLDGGRLRPAIVNAWPPPACV